MGVRYRSNGQLCLKEASSSKIYAVRHLLARTNILSTKKEKKKSTWLIEFLWREFPIRSVFQFFRQTTNYFRLYRFVSWPDHWGKITRWCHLRWYCRMKTWCCRGYFNSFLVVTRNFSVRVTSNNSSSRARKSIFLLTSCSSNWFADHNEWPNRIQSNSSVQRWIEITTGVINWLFVLPGLYFDIRKTLEKTLQFRAIPNIHDASKIKERRHFNSFENVWRSKCKHEESRKLFHTSLYCIVVSHHRFPPAFHDVVRHESSKTQASFRLTRFEISSRN